MPDYLLLIAIIVTIIELIKSPETGFDLVLLGLTLTGMGKGWGLYGLAGEGLIVGIGIYLIVKLLVKYLKATKKGRLLGPS